MNPYEVLGVPETATIEEVTQAYRNRARRYHPDAGGDAWAFKRLEDAYEEIMRRHQGEREPNEAAKEPPARTTPTASPDNSSTGGETTKSDLNWTAVSVVVVAVAWAFFVLSAKGYAPDPDRWKRAWDEVPGIESTAKSHEEPNWQYSPPWRRAALAIEGFACLVFGFVAVFATKTWERMLFISGAVLYGTIAAMFALDHFYSWRTVVQLTHWGAIVGVWAMAVVSIAGLLGGPASRRIRWTIAAVAAISGLILPLLWQLGWSSGLAEWFALPATIFAAMAAGGWLVNGKTRNDEWVIVMVAILATIGGLTYWLGWLIFILAAVSGLVIADVFWLLAVADDPRQARISQITSSIGAALLLGVLALWIGGTTQGAWYLGVTLGVAAVSGTVWALCPASGTDTHLVWPLLVSNVIGALATLFAVLFWATGWLTPTTFAIVALVILADVVWGVVVSRRGIEATAVAWYILNGLGIAVAMVAALAYLLGGTTLASVFLWVVVVVSVISFIIRTYAAFQTALEPEGLDSDTRMGLATSIFGPVVIAAVAWCLIPSTSAEDAGVNLPLPVIEAALTKDQLKVAAHTLRGSWVENDLFERQQSRWHGSSFVIRRDAGTLHLVTNMHCLDLWNLRRSDSLTDDVPEIREFNLVIEFASGKRKRVQRFAVNYDDIDIALLEVDASGLVEGTDYTILGFQDERSVTEGDEVVAVGSPLDPLLSGTQTFGRVSALRRLSEDVLIIQTDAALNQGNSGGPLFQKTAENEYFWIGVNTKKSNLGENLGFALEARAAIDRKYHWFSADADGARNAIGELFD